MGSLSVIAMLVLLVVQLLTGLVSDDEIAFAGPLSPWVSESWVQSATSWHKSLGKWTLLALMSLHLLAILWYKWVKHQSLVAAMWHGDKNLPEGVVSSRDDKIIRLRALLILSLCVLMTFVLVSLG